MSILVAEEVSLDEIPSVKEVEKESERNFLAGVGSGAICKTLEYPLDTVKVLLQSDSNRYSGPIDCLKQTYARYGFKGFYRGLSSPVVGAMLENSVLFVTYGTIKQFLNVNPSPTLENPNPMWKYILSGGMSGVASALVLTPVELVKCNMQVQNSSSAEVTHYKGPVDFIVQTVKKEGPLGLWKGNLSCLAREVPGNMAWFGVYEYMKSRVIQPSLGYDKLEDVPLVYTMLAGGCAGVAYWIVPYPMDTVKSQIQTIDRFKNKSIPFVLRTLYQEKGIKGLYKGSAMTCARAMFSNAILFYCYEVIYKYSGRLFD